MNRELWRIAVTLAASMTTQACAQQPDSAAKAAQTPAGVAVYAMSRGQGVPEPARRVFAQAEALFRELQAGNQVVRIHPVERLGIEGERRVCAEFVDERAARAAHARLIEMAKDVALVNVVMEPCVKDSVEGDRP